MVGEGLPLGYGFLIISSHASGAMELCRISFIRTLNPSYPWGLHLHDVITSQRPHCILPSQWTFKLQLVNFGGAQTFRPKHLKDARDALGN